MLLQALSLDYIYSLIASIFILIEFLKFYLSGYLQIESLLGVRTLLFFSPYQKFQRWGNHVWQRCIGRTTGGEVACIKTLETIKKKLYIRMRNRWTFPEKIE